MDLTHLELKRLFIKFPYNTLYKCYEGEWQYQEIQSFNLVMFWFICHCLSQTERDQRDGKFLID